MSIFHRFKNFQNFENFELTGRTERNHSLWFFESLWCHAVLFHKLQLIIGHAFESRDYSYLISLLSNTTETLEMSHYKPIINPLPLIYNPL